MFDTISKTENNMNQLGYKFITNFDIDDELESIYEEATERYGLDYRIINKAYDCYGKLIPNYKAFYVHVKYEDLSEFWRIYDEVRRDRKHEYKRL